ncbi:MAG: imidazole glycerol phosphate synthase subunit HisH [Anaerolineales bacterium]|jgi:glutamine amidotransferase|nr:imidazole glycerol phosphate synthase subunit HisH [Anaerolineales bacterium]
MATRIALIDHGVGNLRSVEKALAAVGANVVLTREVNTIAAAEKIVLPGVGAFGDCMRGLRASGTLELVSRLAGERPFLGICVGMQMLFESSDEMGCHPGLGLLPGVVTRFTAADIRIPHTGWNKLEPSGEHALLEGIPAGSYAYFNHSYYCAPQNSVDALAYTDYGGHFASVVGNGRMYGIQCHPEKSQHVGLRILRNFVEYG